MSEIIKLSFPADTKYISAIRLCVSAACGNFDFDIDKIEDIKSCVAESCLLFLCGGTCEEFFITADMGNSLEVTVEGRGENADAVCTSCNDFSAEMSRMMIEALADECEIEEIDGKVSKVSFCVKAGE